MPKQQNTTQKAALPLRGSRFFYRAAGSAYKNRLPTALTSIQAAIPQRVGSTAASAVHLRLPVSFLMVISVVAQGQCISEKSMVQRAVTEQRIAWTLVVVFCRKDKLFSCGRATTRMLRSSGYGQQRTDTPLLHRLVIVHFM